MLETLNTVIVSMDIFGIVIDVVILGWFYYTYRKNPGAVMGNELYWQDIGINV